MVEAKAEIKKETAKSDKPKYITNPDRSDFTKVLAWLAEKEKEGYKLHSWKATESIGNSTRYTMILELK